MTRAPEIELLLTQDCTLCETALDVLLGVPELGGMQVRTRDIALDDEAVATYGERIPVLRYHGAELDWPFDAPAVAQFVQVASR